MTVLDLARNYVIAGFSIIPILADGSKRPAIAWKTYQSRMPNESELLRWFGAGGKGIAIVCGMVSGGLEVLDFEDDESYQRWEEIIRRDHPEVLEHLPRVRTPGGGVHVYLRTTRPAGNTKLAITAKGETLIETRGEGGYVLAPGSPPECHQCRGEYAQFAGPDLLGGF